MRCTLKTLFLILHISLVTSLASVKFLSAVCSVSGKGTCLNHYCNVKPIDRFSSMLSVGCGNLTRTVTLLQMNFEVAYKRLGNYRTLLKKENINLCEALKMNKMNSYFGCWVGDCFKNSVKSCPIKDQDLQVNNISVAPTKNIAYPDGFYRSTAHLYDELDEKIFKLIVVMKHDNKMNIKEFK